MNWNRKHVYPCPPRAFVYSFCMNSRCSSKVISHSINVFVTENMVAHFSRWVYCIRFNIKYVPPSFVILDTFSIVCDCENIIDIWVLFQLLDDIIVTIDFVYIHSNDSGYIIWAILIPMTTWHWLRLFLVRTLHCNQDHYRNGLTRQNMQIMNFTKGEFRCLWGVSIPCPACDYCHHTLQATPEWNDPQVKSSLGQQFHESAVKLYIMKAKLFITPI